MRRPITWAELLLVAALLPVTFIGVQKGYEYLTDKISIQVQIKQ